MNWKTILLPTLVIGLIAGTTLYADGHGKKAADNTLSDAEKQEGWVLLFNGKDLAGWKCSPDNPDSVYVEEGGLVTNGKRAHLYYGKEGDAVFTDFELKTDVKCVGKSNSGIFFHTKFQKNGWPAHGYEAQVCNGYKDPRKTGSIYSFADIRDESPAKDDAWFHYHLKVEGKNVKIWIDGELVQDWTQPDDWAQKTKKIGSGTIALQAHDPGSKVLFKNMKLREIK
ncbi:MAG: DUF1080 domain-containing protein [Planctomycetota bacterium]